MHINLQDELEFETATYVSHLLDEALRLIGELGVEEPQTSVEIDRSLKNAYAAVLRWRLEKRLDTGRLSMPST